MPPPCSYSVFPPHSIALSLDVMRCTWNLNDLQKLPIKSATYGIVEDYGRFRQLADLNRKARLRRRPGLSYPSIFIIGDLGKWSANRAKGGGDGKIELILVSGAAGAYTCAAAENVDKRALRLQG